MWQYCLVWVLKQWWYYRMKKRIFHNLPCSLCFGEELVLFLLSVCERTHLWRHLEQGFSLYGFFFHLINEYIYLLQAYPYFQFLHDSVLVVSILEIFLLKEVHLFYIITVVWWSILIVTWTRLGRRNPSSSIASIRMVCEHTYGGIFSLTNWSRGVQHTVSSITPGLGYIRSVAEPEPGNKPGSSFLLWSLLRFLPLGCCCLEFLF